MSIKNLLFISLLITLVACSKSGGSSPEPVYIPPPPPTVSDSMSLPAVDDDVNAFMNKHNVPGLSLAIVKNGKLVYAKGYGFADREANVKVSTTSQFRIASLSKWITAGTIMRFIDQGRLSYNQKVFGDDGVLKNKFGSLAYSDHLKSITIQHLLQHTSGGWSNATNDPMFREAHLNSDDVLDFILDNRPLEHAPGTKLLYSNVGYFILSHIVQELTGQEYHRYVIDSIMKPIGINDMVLGATSLSGKKPNEVKYYGTSSYNYGEGTIARSMGAGGWIGSATDLMRFLVRFDGNATVPDLISTSTLNIMSSRTTVSNSYASGFRVSSNGNWFHGGTYNGSRTWMVKAANGFMWAILTNTTANDSYNTDLDKLIWTAVNNTGTPWPDRDLF